MAVGEFLTFLKADLSFVFDVDLISHKYNFHFLVTVILDLIEPPIDILEGVPLGDIVD